MKFLSDILAKAGLTVDGVVTLNNTATGQTPDANDNSTKLATTAWVRTFVQPYSLPIASASILGGIKVGSGLSIDSGTGVLSVTGASAATIKSTQTFVVTEGQTVYTVTGGYTPGLIDIFLNGVYLSPNQTVATNGTTFTINDPAAAGDIVDVIVASPIFEGASTTTDQLPEGVVNLYYTNARARAAISLTTTGVSGAATYDNVTGVFNIPNYQGLVPAGGNTGDILAKTSATNYDVTWIPNYTSQVQHIVKAGVAVTKGQAVYVSSADGTNMIVSKASNASEQTSSKTLGLVAQNLAINDQGFVVTEGLLAGLDTSTAQAGDPVWLGTDGNLIFGLVNKPYAPAHLVFIGVVTRVQQNNGEIFVHVQNGFELDELHDLSVKNASDGDMIKYVASTGLWTKIAATTTNITEGTNLYYTTARANSDFDTRLATKSTTNLAEGTNLYYTDARVGTYLTANSYATQSYVSTQINNLVSGAPGLLDTLDELAAALGDDPNFATTVSTALSNRLRIDIGTQGLTSTQQGYGRTNLGLGSLAVLSSVGNAQITDLAYSKLTGVPSTFAPSAHTHPISDITGLQTALDGKQASLSGTGFVKISGSTISYDNSTYLTTSSAASTYLPLIGGSLTGNLTFSTQGSKVIFGDSTSASPSMIGEGLVNTEGSDSDFLTIYARNSLRIYTTATNERARFDSNGLRVYGTIIKDGGTSSQFLKADGSVDSSTYLTGITSSQVTTALGYTPYNSTNPSGYTTGSGTQNYIPLWSNAGGTALGNSKISQPDGNNITLNFADTYAQGGKFSYVSTYVSKLLLGRTGTGMTSNVDLIYDIEGTEVFEIRRNYSNATFKISLGATTHFSISNIGAATFNFDNNSSGITFNRNTIGELGSIKNSGSDILYQGTGAVFINADSNSDSTSTGREVKLGNRGVAYMTLASTGAATFSSTISASNFSGSSSGTNTGDQTNISGLAGSETLATVTGRGASTGTAITFSSSAPLNFTSNSNTGTFNRTTWYFNQNNTSASTANGIFIERGRLTDAGDAEIRQFIIGARGGQIQWRVDGTGNTYQTGGISATSGTFSSTISVTGNASFYHGASEYTMFRSTNEMNHYDSSGNSAEFYINWPGGNVNIARGSIVANSSSFATFKYGARFYAGADGSSPPIYFGGETSLTSAKAIYLETYWMVLQGHYNEGYRFRYVNGVGGTTEAMTLRYNNTTINTKITYTDNTYMTGSPSYGFRFNSANDAYNNVIMYDGGNTYYRTSITINYNTSGQPGNSFGTKMWVHDGVSAFANSSTGDSEISTATSSSLLLGPRGARTGTAGRYLAGISFDHLLSYSGAGTNNYSSIPHAWIGLRIVDFPGWERSALVFATREDVNGTPGTTLERACVTPYGQLLVNAQSSGYGVNKYGYNLGVRGNSSQVYMSLALSGQTLDTQGLIVGIDTTYARFHVRDNKGIMFANSDIERVLINTSGSIIASGDITAYGSPSDARLKTIKEIVPNALDKVMKLTGYRFDWNEVSDLAKIKEDVGVIAQEVEKVLPELARTNEDGFMSVRYQGLTAVLIEAVKEQQTQIESQKSEIEELKDLVKQLINR